MGESKGMVDRIEDTYNNLNIILVADTSGLGAEWNLFITRIRRTNHELSSKDCTSVIDPVPCKCPGGTSPDLIVSHLLQLRTEVLSATLYLRRDSVGWLSQEQCSALVAECTCDGTYVRRRVQAVWETAIDSETCFVSY